MIASNTQRPTGRPFEHLNFGSAPVKGFDQVGVPTSRLEGGRFHNPEVIPARVRRIDLNDDLGPAVAIDVADADGSTGVRQAGAVKIRLKRIAGRRHVVPVSRCGIEFHDPEIITARVRRIDLNDDLGPAVAIDVADADRSTGVRQAGAVEIRLKRMTRDRRQVLPVSRRGVEFHDPEIIAARVRRIDLHNHFGPAVPVDVADADRSTRVRQAGAVEISFEGMARDRRHVLPVSRRRVEFHDPEIIAARVRRIDLNDDLGPAVPVDVADADRSTGVRQAGAVEIRLKRMTRDRRQVPPASRRGVKFHDPEIVAARVRRIDLNDDLGPAVAVDVADADRSTGVGQAGTVEISFEGMTRDRRQVLPVRGAKRSGVEFHDPEIVTARVRRIDLNDDLGPAVAIDVADADRSTGVRQAGAVEIRLEEDRRSATGAASFPPRDRIS